MNVKKGVSAPRKGQTSLPQTLAHVIFFHIFFTQASTPSLRGPAIGFKQHDRSIVLCGWMGGWTGCDFSPLSIFLIFKCDNKQHKPDPKMCLKVASAY